MFSCDPQLHAEMGSVQEERLHALPADKEGRPKALYSYRMVIHIVVILCQQKTPYLCHVACAVIF